MVCACLRLVAAAAAARPSPFLFFIAVVSQLFLFLFHLNFFHSVVNCEPSFRSCRSPVHSFIVRHNQKVSCDDSALLYGPAHG